MSDTDISLPMPGRDAPSKWRGQSLLFLSEWLKAPLTIGAVAPSSKAMARLMASVIRPHAGLPVLELGPGTGVMTEAILERGVAPGDVLSVEGSLTFVLGLKALFPGVRFVQGDAFDIKRHAANAGLERFDCAISSLPLLTTAVERRTRLVEAILDLLPPGRPLVQFSYRRIPPAPAVEGRVAVRHIGSVWRNLPPATIWTYQRIGHPRKDAQ